MQYILLISSVSTLLFSQTYLDVLYSSESDIGGFQFNVADGIVIGASGGAAGEAGFAVDYGNGWNVFATGVVLGYSLSGSVIPAGSGVLTTLEVIGSGLCLIEYGCDGSTCLVLSSPDGVTLPGSIENCLEIFYCIDYNENGICDSSESITGDINLDGDLNILDVVLLVNWIFDLTPYNQTADLNDDGDINILDVVTLVNLILSEQSISN